MAKRFFEIFRAGNYPQGSFDAEDIARIAENYDPSFLEAPVTLDHSFGGPAWGWIEELRAEGDRLLASFKDVSDYVVSLTANKQYKRHSVELYNDLEDKGPYLKALSLLGASAPQIKGLEPIEFSTFSENFPEGESATIEFDEPAEPEPGDEPETPTPTPEETDEDEETTGAVEENNEGVSEETETAEDSPEVTPEGGDTLDPDNSETSGAGETQEFAEADITAMQEQINTLQAELDKHKGQVNKFKDENRTLKFDQRKAAFSSFLDKLTGGDTPKLPPKAKDKALAMFSHLDGLKPKKKDETSPLELFKDLLGSLPEIDLSEQAPKQEQPEEMTPPKWAKKAEEYVEQQRDKGNHVSFTEAVKHVKQNS